MILAASLALALGGPAEAAEVPVSADGHAINPTWSKDGKWLAFEVNQYEGSVDLYVVQVENGQAMGSPRKVEVPGSSSSFASGGSIAAGAVWHPEGTLIFEGSSSGTDSRLYFWSPGGARASQLLSASQIGGDLTWPTITADGGTLAFVSDSTGDGDIYTWKQATNEVANAAKSGFSEMAPRFNKDGSSVAYSRKNQGGEDLFVLSGGSSVPRIGGNGDQSRPNWADGGAVVFFTNERGDQRWDIGVSRGPGDKKTIAKDVRLPLRAAPSLSDDGRWVAWGTSVPEKAGKIYVTRVDGSSTVEFSTGLVAAGEPSLVTAAGRTWLAYTALPSDTAAWRQLHIMDITGKLP
jgi:Tol biopolymer transport system component